MKSAQLERVESIVDDFIKKNYPVYGREVPLSIGRSIRGLRAVFGEVCLCFPYRICIM
jgi:alanyl-tRNA synthetase